MRKRILKLFTILMLVFVINLLLGNRSQVLAAGGRWDKGIEYTGDIPTLNADNIEDAKDYYTEQFRSSSLKEIWYFPRWYASYDHAYNEGAEKEEGVSDSIITEKDTQSEFYLRHHWIEPNYIFQKTRWIGHGKTLGNGDLHPQLYFYTSKRNYPRPGIGQDISTFVSEDCEWFTFQKRYNFKDDSQEAIFLDIFDKNYENYSIEGKNCRKDAMQQCFFLDMVNALNMDLKEDGTPKDDRFEWVRQMKYYQRYFSIPADPNSTLEGTVDNPYDILFLYTKAIQEVQKEYNNNEDLKKTSVSVTQAGESVTGCLIEEEITLNISNGGSRGKVYVTEQNPIDNGNRPLQQDEYIKDNYTYSRINSVSPSESVELSWDGRKKM